MSERMTIDAQTPPELLYASYEELTRDVDGHLLPAKLRFYEGLGVSFVLGRRAGVFFEDAYSGRRFINCHSNGGVFNLGHNHPRVVEALRQHLGTLDVGNHHFAAPGRARLASRLAASTGGRLSRVVFGVSGGEVADLAIKVARGRTGRAGIVSACGGYHGHTGLALATGDPTYREPFGPNLPGFVQVPFNDAEEMERAIDDSTAAVILEAIPATLGMPIPREGYFAEVRRLCDQSGAMLIVDEIQTGLGRTGKIWSYQHDGIVPDAILTGKGLSGGVYPITAAIMTESLHDVLAEHPFVHFSTFGGAELGCVAALTVLDIIETPGFLDRVSALSERFANELDGLSFDLRRRGLFLGMKFPPDADAIGSFIKLLEAGVFVFPAANDRSVLQFLPPLVIADDEAGQLGRRLRGVGA